MPRMARFQASGSYWTFFKMATANCVDNDIRYDKELVVVTEKTNIALQNIDKKLKELEDKTCNVTDLQGQVASKINDLVSGQSHQIQGRWQQLLTRKDEIMKTIDDIIKSDEARKKVTASEDALLSEVEVLRENVALKNKHINTRREELEKLQNKTRNDVKSRRNNIAQYSTHLGLDIKHEKDKTLVFTFKYISRDDPEKLFSFHLRLEDHKEYKVIDCQPMVSDLEKLVMELNESNNFKKFVHKMRKEFCTLANK